MTKREKLRQKLRNNPKNATMEEVETLLARFGFSLERVSGSITSFALPTNSE